MSEQPASPGPRVDDALVPRRIFLAMGALVGLLAVIYWFTAYEDAGTVLLALSAVLALWYGVFLWIKARQADREGTLEEGTHGAGAPYLPNASVWPLALGLGMALVLDGLVLGIWVIVPGVGLVALGVVGLIRQSRNRD
jgi:hypothetical protein